MSSSVRIGFWWRVLASCLLIFDYFLWATGNPSITGHVGFYWLTPIVILMTVAASAPRGEQAWSGFLLHTLVIGSTCAALFAAGPYAQELAASRMDAEANSFVKDPINSTVDAPNEQRNLLADVMRRRYLMKRETFIPTFRRMDYLVTSETGEKYRLTVTIGWTGRPEIWMHRVNK